MANMGLDPGLTTLTGQPTVPHTQQITGIDSDYKRPGSMVNGFTDTLLRTLFSSAGAGVLDIGDDMWRTFNDNDPNNHKSAVQMGLDQWKEGIQKTTGPAKPLFGDRQKLKSAADVNYALLKDREDGIKSALDFATRDYKTGTYSGSTRSSAHYARELDPSGIHFRTDIAGTEALDIGASASQITQELNKTKAEINQISSQIESIKNSTDKTQGEKNKQINSRIDEIKYRRMMMLQNIREHEHTISERIGRPFTFDRYNPEEYVNPANKQ
jgi:ElaB/YqjD/DUF883 family membrane-anchored ribosome-binding protein